MANFRRGDAKKNYLEKEMVDAGEFIDQLLDRLFADNIFENPFKTLLADLNQCASCGYTKGIIDKKIISKPKSGIPIGQMQFDYSL